MRLNPLSGKILYHDSTSMIVSRFTSLIGDLVICCCQVTKLFRETVILAQSYAADQAHLRSHSGPGASSSTLGSPSSVEFKLEPQLFRTLVFERLGLPLDVTEARGECGGAVDLQGRHRAACPRSGRLRTRAVGPERTLARVCREAGATVRWQAKLRDVNVTVSANDEGAIEVLASGLPLFQGAQLAVDITIRSVLTATGAAGPNTSHTVGAALLHARKEKESASMRNCWLVTVVDSLWWASKREDDGVPSPWNSSTVWRPPKHAKHRWSCGGQCPKVGGEDGHECCPCLAAGHSRVLWCLPVLWVLSGPKEVFPSWPICSRSGWIEPCSRWAV